MTCGPGAPAAALSCLHSVPIVLSHGLPAVSNAHTITCVNGREKWHMPSEIPAEKRTPNSAYSWQALGCIPTVHALLWSPAQPPWGWVQGRGHTLASRPAQPPGSVKAVAGMTASGGQTGSGWSGRHAPVLLLPHRVAVNCFLSLAALLRSVYSPTGSKGRSIHRM